MIKRFSAFLVALLLLFDLTAFAGTNMCSIAIDSETTLKNSKAEFYINGEKVYFIEKSNFNHENIFIPADGSVRSFPIERRKFKRGKIALAECNKKVDFYNVQYYIDCFGRIHISDGCFAEISVVEPNYEANIIKILNNFFHDIFIFVKCFAAVFR